MIVSLRTAPAWVWPFVLVSLAALLLSTIVLAAYFAFVGLGIGTVLVAKSTKKSATEISAKYEEMAPTKAWDGLWGWLTIRDVDHCVRFGLASAATSVALIVIAIGVAGEGSPALAWGVVGGTAVTAGVESFMRHRGIGFRPEAWWVAIECLSVAVVTVVTPTDWILGAAAAMSVEIVGFIAVLGVAASRVAAVGDGPCRRK